ncbi:MAG: type I methionyl aminopeptidase [Ruminococcus sp.]|nr:type I methionyl aminopeptidase [Ruminococcus sp.]
MINIKSASEIAKMKTAGRITGEALKLAGESIRPGMSTKELDTIIHDYIVSCGATPSFLGYGGFTGSACISINEEVIHGIPGKRKILDGDIVSVDVGAYIDGFHGDSARTFVVGKIPSEVEELLKVTEEALFRGIEKAVAGNRIGDISHAIEEHVRKYNFGIVKEYIGHGVGRDLHEEPEVPNYGKSGHGPRLYPGMVIAIEPMINLKGDGVRTLKDGWTVVTKSGTASAHFEHTIAITNDKPIILTKVD